MKTSPSTRRTVAARLRPFLAMSAVAIAAGGSAIALAGPAAPINPDLVPKDLAATVLPAGFSTTNAFTQGTACVFDYDRDDIRDFLLSEHGYGWRLMHGRPDGTFEEVERLPSTDRHGCAVGDFGGYGPDGTYTGPDGRLDIYTTIGACQGTCDSPFPNELWLQRPDGTFVRPEQDARTASKSRPNDGQDNAYAFKIDDEHGRGREPLAFDANNDGKMDLFVGNDEGVKYDSSNRIYLNNGDGTFTKKTLPAPAEVGSLGSAAGDFDGDGLTDLLNVADVDYGKLQLYRNTGNGNFTDVAGPAGITDIFDGKDADFADIDGDGRLDLVITRFNAIEVRLNRGGKFGTVDFSRKISGGSGVAVGDADGDGLVDVFGVTLDNELARGADVLLRNMGHADENGKWVFDEIAFPQAKRGNGDVAAVMPSYNGTNRAAFIVNNGKWSDSGPWQFIYLTGPSTGPPDLPTTTTPTTPTTPTSPTTPTTPTGPTTPTTPATTTKTTTTKTTTKPDDGPSRPGQTTGEDPGPGPGDKENPPHTGKPGKVTFTAAQLRATQRISQAALRRANTLQAILDGRRAAKPSAGGKSVRIKLTVRQLRINQRIAQAALRRVNALQARLNGKPVPKGATSRPARITLTLKQMRINNRIALAALKRVNALAARMAREGYPVAPQTD